MTADVLITGGSGGIGRAIALELAKVGRRPILVARRRDRLDAAASEISRLSGLDPLIAVSDLRDRQDARSAAERLLADGASWSAVVNCVGEINYVGNWEEADEHAWTADLSSNLVTVVNACDAFIPAIPVGGHVVNIGSLYGSVPAPYVLPYASAKAAVAQLGRSIAMALAERRISVVTLCPGNIDTAMTRSGGDEYVADVVSKTPFQKLGSASEVARVVRVMLESSFITGTEVVIDGGIQWTGG